jgi:hypothetical protein
MPAESAIRKKFFGMVNGAAAEPSMQIRIDDSRARRSIDAHHRASSTCRKAADYRSFCNSRKIPRDVLICAAIARASRRSSLRHR